MVAYVLGGLHKRLKVILKAGILGSAVAQW